MPRDSSVYLEDIVTAAARIAAYVTGHTRESFAADAKTVDAVVRNLEIVGEAVKQVPAEVRQQAPDIEWPKIAGLRDILIHATSTHRLGRRHEQAAWLRPEGEGPPGAELAALCLLRTGQLLDPEKGA